MFIRTERKSNADQNWESEGRNLKHEIQITN